MGVRVKGFPAWAICRFYHLAWLPGLDRKSRLIADWSVEILFPRDLAEMGQLGHPPPLEPSADANRRTAARRRAVRAWPSQPPNAAFCPDGRSSAQAGQASFRSWTANRDAAKEVTFTRC